MSIEACIQAQRPDDRETVAVSDRIARCEERRETNWIALIRLSDGTEIPTTVKDISASGARLLVPRSSALPDRFMFKVIGRDFICSVHLAWRRDDAVGVRIERVGRLSAVQPREAAQQTTDTAGAALGRRSRFSRTE